MNHVWKKSTLGHGETMCEFCKGTNRELKALGQATCPDRENVARIEVFHALKSSLENGYDPRDRKPEDVASEIAGDMTELGLNPTPGETLVLVKQWLAMKGPK